MKTIGNYLAAVLTVLLIIWCLKPVPKVGKDGIDYARLGEIPVQSHGRVKPLSTEALTSLRTLSGKSAVRREIETADGKKKKLKEPAIVWYARVLFDHEAAAKDPVFRIDNPEVKDHLDLDPAGKTYTYADLQPNLEKIQKAAEPAREKHAKKRTPFEGEMVNLFEKVVLYTALSRSLEIQEGLGFAECATGAQRLVPALEGLGQDPSKWSEEERQTAEMTRRLFGLIGQMASTCPLNLVPPATADRNAPGMDPAAWRNPYAALFMGIRDEDPGQDLAFSSALAAMQTAWRNLDAEADPKDPDATAEARAKAATAFNAAVEDWHKAVVASDTQLQQAKTGFWLSWFNPFLRWSFGSLAGLLAILYLVGGRNQRVLQSCAACIVLIVAAPLIASGVDSLIVGDQARILGVSAFENWHNAFEPFYKAIVLYVAAFILACVAFLGDGKAILRWAAVLTVAALAFHSLGLVDRMIIGGRPPVTTLHSSALFIGWVCVILGLVLERFYKGGIGIIVATVIASITLMKGFQLAADGSDTMGALVAVLDSNFWLATHVICITIGYAACYVAALVAHVYLFRGIFTNSLDQTEAKKLDSMNYGIICFGLFFSVVGTILGGIWADQSWGRFWGWDPKENGAMMICLWLIVLLHARLGGYLKIHGMMLGAVGASIITTVSWFGVNLMGTGLHSYGFTREGLFSFLGFIALETGVLLVGAIPRRTWRSAAALGLRTSPKNA